MGINSVTMKDLLEAGVHFGHQTRRWNPKMARYIYGQRDEIYILDLKKTVGQMKLAYKYLRDTVRQGGNVLLVSTKKQAEDIIKSEAERCGMYYVNQRWLGGMLTNFQTITKRIKHMNSLEKMEADGIFEAFSKKEESQNRKQLARLRKYLTGIREMGNLPDAMFLIDPRRENIALKEAQRLNIPVVAIVDTNCDPEGIDIPIPGNDDAIRAIKIVTNYLVDAMVEGLGQRKEQIEAQKKGSQEESSSEDSKDKKASNAEAAAPSSTDAKDAQAKAEASSSSAEESKEASAQQSEEKKPESTEDASKGDEKTTVAKVVASASPDEES